MLCVLNHDFQSNYINSASLYFYWFECEITHEKTTHVKCDNSWFTISTTTINNKVCRRGATRMKNVLWCMIYTSHDRHKHSHFPSTGLGLRQKYRYTWHLSVDFAAYMTIITRRMFRRWTDRQIISAIKVNLSLSQKAYCRMPPIFKHTVYWHTRTLKVDRQKEHHYLQYIPRNMHTVLLCSALLWLCHRS